GNASNPVQFISAISPSAVAIGSPGFTLTVTGTNFVSGAVVRWNGLDRPTTFVSGSQLWAMIPGSDLTASQGATIMVFNPPPDGGASNSATFALYTVLTLPTKDLIYDGMRRKIYASLPGTAPNGNSIISIDPFTSAVGSPVPIGFEP